jgi:C4-dicarboxylate transporter, DctQ subunit
MLRRFYERAEEGAIALLLAAMTLVTFAQVVLRYVFNDTLLWALEATTYMFGWLVLFGISYGVRVHAHIGIDLLVKALPRNPRRAVGLLALGCAMLYAALMAYGAYGYVRRMFALGIDAQDIPVQRWILGLILPVGFALLGLRLLEQAVAVLRGRAPGFELADEAADLLRERGLTGRPAADAADVPAGGPAGAGEEGARR